ncbi:hypothetical protein CJF42_24540 [Pseudoalteromonas sp. NBT06-2]|uniref:DUF262 domain-containing protein n=1 Tax=Pseudoalteromonas sp. NBT06-2 TaxID=2025950 RepID=UPI000BA6FB86|nr:DUF262 domain-containing protein [Pseudoalteromonas sp. NBT06-2]PAJ71831.1 hypothetical protein CJF42_24540 [Pseudoalteromonas sp. NBT06-2]
MSSNQVLNLYPIDYPFETLISRVDKKKLILDPDFQRKYKWDKDGNVRASRFIESCLMRIPLPACYFSEDSNKNHLVIDGVQRITTVKNFLNDEFSLEGLTVFTELNGKKFSELEGYRSDLENYTIRCIVLRNDNPSHLVQDIFARLNEGSVILSHQEIRHALYAGKFNDLIHELGSDSRIENFGRGKRGSQVKDSLEPQQQVLRFFAFYENSEQYDESLKEFLDSYMHEHQHDSENKIRKMKRLFKTSLDKCFSVFDEDTFIDTTKSRPKESLVYFDLLMKDFSDRDSKFLTDNKIKIKNAFKDYCGMPDIKKTLSGGTLNKSKINVRDRVWAGLMDNI